MSTKTIIGIVVLAVLLGVIIFLQIRNKRKNGGRL